MYGGSGAQEGREGMEEEHYNSIQHTFALAALLLAVLIASIFDAIHNTGRSTLTATEINTGQTQQSMPL